MDKTKFRKAIRIIGFTEDVTAIPKLIVFGGSAVTYVLAHIFQAIRDLSLGYQVILGLGVLLLWLAGVLFVLEWLRRRRPQSTNITDTSQTPDMTPSKDLSWLERLASQDIDNLSQRIKAEVRKLDFNNLKQLNPEFEVSVSIVNTSVYKLELKSHVGFIQFGGSNWEPKFDPVNFTHSERKTILLRQTVTQEVAKYLMNEANAGNPVNFVCGQYRLVFNVLDKDYEECKAEIPVREGGLPCIPKGVVVVATNDIGVVVPITPHWLEQTAKHDKENLSKCFKLLGIGWNYSPGSEPYIMALANMENKSVFLLKVVGVKGCIYINAMRCNLPITLDCEHEFSRLHHEVIKIRQAINPDTAKIITELKDKKETFYIDLSGFFLTVQILEPEHEPQIVNIPIGTQFGVSHITKI